MHSFRGLPATTALVSARAGCDSDSDSDSEGDEAAACAAQADQQSAVQQVDATPTPEADRVEQARDALASDLACS